MRALLAQSLLLILVKFCTVMQDTYHFSYSCRVVIWPTKALQLWNHGCFSTEIRKRRNLIETSIQIRDFCFKLITPSNVPSLSIKLLPPLTRIKMIDALSVELTYNNKTLIHVHLEVSYVRLIGSLISFSCVTGKMFTYSNSIQLFFR